MLNSHNKTEYLLISAQDRDEFVAQVQKAISQGWKLYRSLIVTQVTVQSNSIPGASTVITTYTREMVKAPSF